MQNTFQPGQSALGIASANGLTPAQFLSYNPHLAATGYANDSQGLSGLVQVGTSYNLSPNNTVNTSTASRNTFNTNSANLATALAGLNPQPNTGEVEAPADNSNDPFITALNNMHTGADNATRSLIASTTAAYQNKINDVTKEGENYKLGLQQLGVETGAAEATPDLLAGHIHEAANEEMSKVNALKAEEAKVLMDAQQAKRENDFQTLDKLEQRRKDIQKEKNDVIKNMYDKLSSENKASDEAVKQIYSTLQTLSTTEKNTFLTAVAKKYKLPLGGLVQALAEYDTSFKGKQATTNKKISGATGGGTGTFKVSTGISKLTPKLEGAKGADGYIDPYKWIDSRKWWNEQGGTDASFNTTFKKYLNPASYKLAGFKTTTKSNRGGK